MNTSRWIMIIFVAVVFVAGVTSMSWSELKMRPAGEPKATIQTAPRKVTEAEDMVKVDKMQAVPARKTTPVLEGLDLAIWMTPYLAYGPGGQTVHIKNIGTVGAGTQTFTAEFKAKGENSNSCFEYPPIVKVVPGPNGELTINIKGSDISNYLGSPPIGWLARITQSPPESNNFNNSQSINLTPGQCN